MAQKTYILDTSVAIKWFAEESDTPESLKLREMLQKKEIMLAAPDLILYELANALRWNKNMSEEGVCLAIRSFNSCGVHIFRPSMDVLADAVLIAYAKSCTVYDAVFLSLAAKTASVLITADEKLIKSSPDLAITL